MKYKILIKYRTGDSFRNEDTSDFLDLEWDSLAIAKENLKAIQDHWEMYSKVNSYSFRTSKESKSSVLASYSNNWWYVKNLDSFFPENQMMLKADNGNLMQQSNFWCGYFEHLYSAEIIVNKSDIKFTTE